MIPVFHYMAKQVKATPAPYKARRVNIPAGKKFLTFNPGDSVYIIEGDGTVYPQALRETFEKREGQAYEKGLQEGAALVEKRMEEQSRNCRMRTPEETLRDVLAMIRGHHAKDQNQILAVIMDEMGKGLADRIKGIVGTIEQQQDLLKEAELAFAGFHNVRNGGFEKLNFR